MESLQSLFDTSDFPARWHCGRWTQAHGWTHVLADTAIFGAYLAIPLLLFYFLRRRPDVPFPRVLLLFVVFILSCGLTHLMEATIFWVPAYRFSALLKVVTALVSWVAVAALLPTLPRALEMPTLARANEELEREMHERERIERDLRASEERFQLAVAGSAVGLWNWNIETEETWFGPQVRRLLGLPEDDPFPRDRADWSTRMHPDDREEVERALEASLERDEPFDVRTRMQTADRGYRWFRTTGSVLRRAAGRPLYMAGSIQDVTDLVHAHDELQRSNRDLENFAYVASHDLQQPLRMVASFCQLLQRRYGGQLDATADEYIGFAVEGALRMQKLIDDLLAFSRVGARQAPEPVELSGALEAARANLALLVEEVGGTVVHGELPQVWADRGQLVLLLQNLLQNALKFRREGVPPVVRVEARRTGSQWTISVEDNGPGIPPEHHRRIFQVFQRLHGSHVEGTGIGLAICQRIVERQGGRIWVESAPGDGSRFLFTLPSDGSGPREVGHASDPAGRGQPG